MNGRMLNMLLAGDNIGGIFGAFPIIKTIMLIIMILCALFIICVVLFQPSNSSGVSALGGTTETFLSKNKSKTNESKLRNGRQRHHLLRSRGGVLYFAVVLICLNLRLFPDAETAFFYNGALHEEQKKKICRAAQKAQRGKT